MTQLLSHDQAASISRRQSLKTLAAGAFALGALPQALLAETPRIAAITSKVSKSHPLAAGLHMAADSLDALDSIEDYTATFHKNEMVGKKRIAQRMSLKLREKPFSVYLRFEAPAEGREVIYIDGQNDGDLLVHETGLTSLIGTIGLDPKGNKAMEEARYPVTMIGMRTMLNQVIAQWQSEIAITDTKVRYFPNAKVDNVECRVFESSHAEPARGVKFHMTRLYVEKDNKLPVRVEQFDFPAKTGAQPAIVEQYTYLNVKTNVGLKDIDFDVKNPAYEF
ncbi:DUF1571 domain-containing protein [bacterium]|nr:DUF1571 domain-containing protein [bacterium]